MKTILVPTDFSENAFIATQYAASLAEKTKQKLELFNVHIALYIEKDELIEKEGQTAIGKMKTLVATLQSQYPTVDITGSSVQGFMIDKLKEKLDEESFNLIVMGTKGATNVAEDILGSTTFEVIKKSPIPVLVVPENTPDFKFDRLGFFSAYKDAELDTILRLRHSLGSDYALKIVHLYTAENQEPFEAATRWKKKINNAFPDDDISFETIRVGKINTETVAGVAEGQQLDLLIFARPHKTFFQTIFAKSLTKEVANHPVVPSLFIKESGV